MSQLRVTTLNNASNTGTANITLDASGNATVGNTLVMGSSFKRNRIINGNMVIDQRNAGASVTPTNQQYLVDRWLAGLTQSSKFSVQQDAGAVTPPVGFVDYLGCTSLSAYTVLSGDTFFIQQSIEGLNVADLGWGTANARTVTLSFWVRSSLTGTFGGTIQNSAVNRAYPFTFIIGSTQSNQWVYQTVTIPGDTSGTWLTTNGIGLRVTFSLGTGTALAAAAGSWAAGNFLSATGATSVVGTNGATFYITGVQLEVSSVATPYERQIYSEQLAQCQRYYCKTFPIGTAPANNATKTGCLIGGPFLSGTITHAPSVNFIFPVSMRAAPTVTTYNAIAGTSGQWSGNDSSTVLANATVRYANNEAAQIVNSATTTTADWWQIHAVAEIEL